MTELLVTLDLPAYLTRLGQRINAEFASDFNTIALYPVRTDMAEGRYADVAVPALMLDLFEAEPIPEDNRYTEQLSVFMRLSAHLVYPMDHPNMHQTVRAKALQFAQFIHRQNKFGLAVGEAIVENVAVDEDVMEQSDRYYAWVVEWGHTALLGDSVYDVANFKPTDVFLGYAPNIGATHEADYVQLPLPMP